MRVSRRRWASRLVVVLVVGLAACSNGKASPPGATVPSGDKPTTTPSSVTTVAEPASYEVPEVIDQAYVQKVVSAFDEVLGDAIRVLVRDQGVSEEFLKHLLAIYTEQEFDVHQQSWRAAVAKGDLGKRPATPGNPVTTVHALVEANAGCVIARTDTDLRRTLTVEPEESPQDDYIVLVRKKDGRDPLAVNRTPWVMAFDGSKNDGSVPRNSCGD